MLPKHNLASYVFRRFASSANLGWFMLTATGIILMARAIAHLLYYHLSGYPFSDLTGLCHFVCLLLGVAAFALGGRHLRDADNRL